MTSAIVDNWAISKMVFGKNLCGSNPLENMTYPLFSSPTFYMSGAVWIVSQLGKGNHWENNPAQKGNFSCCSAAIPFPVRQIHEDNFHWQQRRLPQYVQQQIHFLRSKICVQNPAKNYNKDDFWKLVVNCRTGNRTTKPTPFFLCVSTSLALSHAICQSDSKVICISSDY